MSAPDFRLHVAHYSDCFDDTILLFLENDSTARRRIRMALPSSVVTGCFNEEENVSELYERVCSVFDERPAGAYTFELIVIDNASTDRTVEVLKANRRHGQAGEDHRQQSKLRPCPLRLPRLPAGEGATPSSCMVSDLQDPPGDDPGVRRKWEEGYKIVLAQKTNSEESRAVLPGAQILLQHHQPALRYRARQERHRIWPLRPGGSSRTSAESTTRTRTSAG